MLRDGMHLTGPALCRANGSAGSAKRRGRKPQASCLRLCGGMHLTSPALDSRANTLHMQRSGRNGKPRASYLRQCRPPPRLFRCGGLNSAGRQSTRPAGDSRATALQYDPLRRNIKKMLQRRNGGGSAGKALIKIERPAPRRNRKLFVRGSPAGAGSCRFAPPTDPSRPKAG